MEECTEIVEKFVKRIKLAWIDHLLPISMFYIISQNFCFKNYKIDSLIIHINLNRLVYIIIDKLNVRDQFSR